MRQLLGKNITVGLLSQGYYLEDGTLVRLIGIDNDLTFSKDNGLSVFTMTVDEAESKLSLDDPNYDEDALFVPSWS